MHRDQGVHTGIDREGLLTIIVYFTWDSGFSWVNCRIPADNIPDPQVHLSEIPFVLAELVKSCPEGIGKFCLLIQFSTSGAILIP